MEKDKLPSGNTHHPSVIRKEGEDEIFQQSARKGQVLCNNFLKPKKAPNNCEENGISCLYRGSPFVSHAMVRVTLLTSTCLSSQRRKACAMSAFRTSNKVSRIADLLLEARVCSSLAEKNACPSSFLYAGFPFTSQLFWSAHTCSCVFLRPSTPVA